MNPQSRVPPPPPAGALPHRAPHAQVWSARAGLQARVRSARAELAESRVFIILRWGDKNPRV